MNEISERLAKCSPEKREFLKRILAQQGLRLPDEEIGQAEPAVEDAQKEEPSPGNPLLDKATMTGIITVGLDLSPSAIAFCQRAHRYPNAQFVQGDAEHLPFEKEAFDAVTNVESLHSYPHLYRFYDEVNRVLKPGGKFLYGDISAESSNIPDALRYLQSLGFMLERDTDITSNVLKSCDEISEDRIRAFQHANDEEVMGDFMAAPGSRVYRMLEARASMFKIFRFKKDAAFDH